MAGLTFAGWEQPIGCGGVAVFPGDVVVADDDGAVVLPSAMVKAVLETAAKKERMEAWILDRVNEGRGLLGLYPPNQQTLDEYETWCRTQAARVTDLNAGPQPSRSPAMEKLR